MKEKRGRLQKEEELNVLLYHNPSCYFYLVLREENHINRITVVGVDQLSAIKGIESGDERRAYLYDGDLAKVFSPHIIESLKLKKGEIVSLQDFLIAGEKMAEDLEREVFIFHKVNSDNSNYQEYKF
jgi:hypothetical protein